MLTKKRKPVLSRREAVRRAFREQAMRLNPSPFVQFYDGSGRPRRAERRQKA